MNEIRCCKMMQSLKDDKHESLCLFLPPPLSVRFILIGAPISAPINNSIYNIVYKSSSSPLFIQLTKVQILLSHVVLDNETNETYPSMIILSIVSRSWLSII